MYVQKGSVKLTVVNESGKEAVVAIFSAGDFFGEGGMAGQTIRMGTATAIVPTIVLIIGKDEMMRVLHAEPELSDRFITYMLARTSELRRTWSTSSSTRRRRDWPAHFCCSLAMARKASPSEYFRRFPRRR
jgi:CRP-like cAMP-binding protein